MIAFLIFILCFNILDYFVTRHGGKPNYAKYNLIKTFFGIVCAFWMVNFSSWWSVIISGGVAALFEATSFWVLYELIRNFWSRRPFTMHDILYFDQVEHDSGGIDLFFSKHSWTVHALAKLAALILAVLSGILITYIR